MRKIKLFEYDHAPGHVHDTIPEYRNSVPFSEDGIAEHCELVDPKDAELFYCGQYANNARWMLHANRFEFWEGNEHRHVFDIEGDWCGPWPDWIKPALITAMNAMPEHQNWHVMVRPGCSMLLMDMIDNPRRYTLQPEQIGFCFRGQRDRHGLREKVFRAWKAADVPGSFTFTDRWGAMSMETANVYEEELAKWSFSLCPGGEGRGMTCRYFETCVLGRIPIVIADNLLFEQDRNWGLQRHGADVLEETLVRWFQKMMYVGTHLENEVAALCGFVADYQRETIREYFADPTDYFLDVCERRGYIDRR